jgi:hypothetical protein
MFLYKVLKSHIFSRHPFNHLQFFSILYIYTMFSRALHKLTINIHYFADTWDFFFFFFFFYDVLFLPINFRKRSKSTKKRKKERRKRRTNEMRVYMVPIHSNVISNFTMALIKCPPPSAMLLGLSCKIVNCS